MKINSTKSNVLAADIVDHIIAENGKNNETEPLRLKKIFKNEITTIGANP